MSSSQNENAKRGNQLLAHHKFSYGSQAMFVSWKILSGKPFFKFSCVCLSLKKLVNEKYFPVNEKHFSVNGKHFPVNFSKKKIWFGFQE